MREKARARRLRPAVAPGPAGAVFRGAAPRGAASRSAAPRSAMPRSTASLRVVPPGTAVTAGLSRAGSPAPLHRSPSVLPGSSTPDRSKHAFCGFLIPTASHMLGECSHPPYRRYVPAPVCADR
ncbi:hypothetical protein GCM10018793_34930 [Streptomyces sulfonofaciens]|uniref:Uncharacterized protein n=1 Tax=Streptomyces sulfonofaciens TaxID=68272 RepID=A0A919L1Q7_9ACTN|nr:hypothetical protein GCM10018793_34930 [Streptomyces sulfonofaciens]